LVTTPQAAIVFAGDIVDTPVAIDGTVEIRPILGIAVGYDHRIIDGATGGQFCRALRAALENPQGLETAARSAS
jgi:pyruvate dehydrogenase E2 component (dihydrolipoamide acetyltransferase)